MATNTWTGGAGDGLWETNGNWSLDHAPTTSEDAVVGGSANISYDAAGFCKTLDTSTFTGSLNHIFLQVAGPGAITLGAGGDFTSLRVALNGASAISLDGNGKSLYGFIVFAGTTLTLTDHVTLTGSSTTSGTIAIGNFNLSLSGAGCDFTISAANSWTWGTGKVIMSSGAILEGRTANLSSPSMPPVLVSSTCDLLTGDIRVASITETWTSLLTRNGNTVYDASDNPIAPPSPPAPTVTDRIRHGLGLGLALGI